MSICLTFFDNSTSKFLSETLQYDILLKIIQFMYNTSWTIWSKLFLILFRVATDGLWNVMRANECVNLVRQTDKETEKLLTDTNRTEIGDTTSAPVQPFVNPSQRLVNTAMQRCCEKMIRADNTSCITIMLDQPPSYEDYLTNSNETVIRATNLTNLDINKSEFYLIR